jgi:signal transduction histidine kinase/DNA-binding response OmpR family regulator/HPt (histidine-containing phosphotransfer) domain-containing protein
LTLRRPSGAVARVTACVFVAALVLAGVAVAGLRSLRGLHERAAVAERRLYASALELGDAHARTFAVEADLRALSAPGGESAAPDAARRVGDNLAALRQDLDRYDARRASDDVVEGGQGTHAAEATALALARTGVAALDTVARGVLAGRPATSAAIGSASGAAAAPVARLTDLNRFRGDLALAGLEEQMSEAESGALWALGVAALLAVLSAVLVGRSLAFGLRSLSASSARLAEGELEDDAGTGAADECGDVRRNLDRIRGLLRERDGQIARLRAELEAQRGHVEDVERASESKTRFIGNVSHEFRTPLSSIIGFASLLAGEDARLSPVRRGEYLEIVLRNARHLLHVINDILNLSKVEAGTLEVSLAPVYVPEVLAGVVASLQPLADQQGVGMRFSDAGRHFAIADTGRLRQVLFNVLENAIKYSPPGSEADVLVTSGGGEVRVEVRDQGPGIAPEDQDRLFKEFSRISRPGARVAGAGLGLALSKQLVELMGGRIGVESGQGRGSVFWVALRAGDEILGTAAAEAEAWEVARPTRGETVAVIDDDADIRAYATVILEHAGYVAATDDGSPGVADRIVPSRPSLVLLDLNLVGRTGAQVLEELRGMPEMAGVPVLAFTAGAAPEGETAHVGFAGHVVKPIEPAELIQRVDSELAKAVASPGFPNGNASAERASTGPSRSSADAEPDTLASSSAPHLPASPTELSVDDRRAALPPSAEVGAGDADEGRTALGDAGPYRTDAGDVVAREEDAGDEDDYLAPLRARFRAGLPVRLEAMEEAARDGDLPTLIREVHKLRGAAAGYGLDDVSESAGDAEERLREGAGADDASVKALATLVRAVISGERNG